MEFILSIFQGISNLGSTLMLPIMFTIIGLIIGCKFSKALKAGITVSIGLIGINLVMNLVYNNMEPVADILVSEFGFNFKYLDVGWAAVSAVAFSTLVGAFIIPYILLVNVILISLKATRTINIDIWNYWHYALTGSFIHMATGNLLLSFLGATVHFVASLVVADRTAKQVQEVMGIPGISIPQGYAAATVPHSVLVGKIFDLFSKNKDVKKADAEKVNKFKENEIIQTITDPIFIGLIIGTIIALIVGYDLKSALTVGISMFALMYLLPRMAKVLMEGLLPISNAAKAYMTKRFKGQDFYIGMDSAVLLGHPTTITVGLILMPITLILAVILPGNALIPLAGISSMQWDVAMSTVIHKGKFWRTLVSGIIGTSMVLLISSFFGPYITQFALSGAISIPEGATGISAMTVNLFTFIPFVLANIHIIGPIVLAVLTIGLAVWNHVWLKNQTNLQTTEFIDADASSYAEK